MPNATTDQELQHLRNSLPDEVAIRRVDERLSALGNVIACNDHVAIVHAEISAETEQVISPENPQFLLIFLVSGSRRSAESGGIPCGSCSELSRRQLLCPQL